MSKVYKIVTDTIISELEKGVVPWKRDWVTDKYNYVTGYAYRGINLLLLPNPGGYLTYKQVKHLDVKIKKGAVSYIVTFAKKFWITEDKQIYDEREFKGKTEDEILEIIDTLNLQEKISLRYYRVYHESDIEGLPEKKSSDEKIPKDERYQEAEDMAQAYLTAESIKLNIGEEPVYRPLSDSVSMPDIKFFNKPDNYYSALFHEITHSTGVPKRLNRYKAESATKTEYSKEELVAEIGAAMLSSIAGLDVDWQNTAAYIDGWLEVLKKDEKLIVKASALAQNAVEYVLNKSKNKVSKVA